MFNPTGGLNELDGSFRRGALSIRQIWPCRQDHGFHLVNKMRHFEGLVLQLSQNDTF